MQTAECAQMTRQNDKFNFLLSTLQSASGLPQKRQKTTDQNSGAMIANAAAASATLIADKTTVKIGSANVAAGLNSTAIEKD